MAVLGLSGLRVFVLVATLSTMLVGCAGGYLCALSDKGGEAACSGHHAPAHALPVSSGGSSEVSFTLSHLCAVRVAWLSSAAALNSRLRRCAWRTMGSLGVQLPICIQIGVGRARPRLGIPALLRYSIQYITLRLRYYFNLLPLRPSLLSFGRLGSCTWPAYPFSRILHIFRKRF